MRPFKKPKSLEEEIRELAKKIVNAAEQGNDSLVAALERQQAVLERQQAELKQQQAAQQAVLERQQAELKQQQAALERQQAALERQQAKKANEKAKASFESIKKPGIKKEDAKIVMDQAHAMYLALSGTHGFVSHAKIS